MLILDSWRGQNNPAIYNKKFLDDSDKLTCTAKILPPKCITLHHPCGVYFYRQAKNYITKIQNCPDLIADYHEVSSRKDCIKLHV
jgi:hypothetical protein